VVDAKGASNQKRAQSRFGSTGSLKMGGKREIRLLAVTTIIVVDFIAAISLSGAGSHAKRRAAQVSNTPAPPSQLELISKADPNQSSATAGALMTNQRCFSADGRYVVFESSAENLVGGQVEAKITNNIFLHDRVTNSTVLVSHAVGSTTTTANETSFVPSISADGRFVVYWSFASNLVAGQNDNGESSPDVFLYDRMTGANTLVSHIPGAPTTTGDSNSFDPIISPDGRFVAFTSSASNLVLGQTDGGGGASIFLWDRVNDTLTLVAHKSGNTVTTSDGFSFNPVLSDDGSFLAFESNASNLVAGQTQSARRFEIFLWNRSTGETKVLSHNASSATTATNGSSFGHVMSADASYIAFYSSGSDLVSGEVDANQTYDTFLYERATGAITLVSHQQGSTITAGAMQSVYPDISADGRYVVFQSTSPDLVANDLNNAEDVFVWDRTTNTNTLISRSASSAVSASANAKSFGAKISADGKTISFTSKASDLLPGQTASGQGDVFFLDQTTSTLHLISHLPGSTTNGGNDESFLPLISTNGAFIAFDTLASNVVPNDNNGSGDVLIYDRASDTNTAASLHAANLPSISANGHSGSMRASADGRFVVFTSEATNLVPNQSDVNNGTDIFVRDRQTNTTKLVSHASGSPATTANAASDSPAISTDGQWITYVSKASDLINGLTDLNGGANVFLYDRVNDTTTLVSHSVLGTSFTASDRSDTPAISGDGRFVVYVSYATDLMAGQTDSNNGRDVFVFDRTTGTNTLVSHDSAAPNVAGIRYSFAPSISIDGKFIAYYSAALDLVPSQSNANNSVQHCFLYDCVANTNTLVDHQFGIANTSGDGNAGSTEPLDPPIFSADGYYIAYVSGSTNLVSGQKDTNGNIDIFLFDRAAGTNLLVSHRADSLTTTGSDISFNPSVSADGRFVSYRSQATDLAPGQSDSNTFQDVFLFDRITRTNTLVTHAFGQPTTAGNGSSGEAPRYGYQSVSPDGRFVAFWSSSTDLIPNFVDQNGFNGDLFLFDRLSDGNILLSHALGADSTGGNNGSGDSQHIGGPTWSGDGHSLLFASRASNLISGDFNNREDVFAFNVPVLPVSVVSRKTHGLAGTFDVDLAFASAHGIECRSGGANGDFQIIVTFAVPITFTSASVSGTGSVAAALSSGNQVFVNLTGVTNAQRITITLTSVNDGTHVADVSVPMGVLLGDVDGSGRVDSTDVFQVRQQTLQNANASNFRTDVDESGRIDSTDVFIVRQQTLTALP
jgi:Tol biopolymer transport system component